MARAVRYLLLLIGCLAYASTASAQTGTITANGQCQAIDASNKGQGTLEVSGTWTGTLTWYVSNGVAQKAVDLATPDVPGTAVNSTTANGHWQGNVAGWRLFSVCATATMTGSATIWLNASDSGGGSGGGGGGGGGAVTIANGDDTALGSTTDAAATAGGDGTISAKQKLMTTQLEDIKTAAQSVANTTTGGVNIAKIGGSDPTPEILIDTDTSGTTTNRAATMLAAPGGAGAVVINGDSTNGLDVDVTRLPALVAGTALVGRVQIDAQAANGDSSLKYTSAGSTEDEHNVCSAACRLDTLVVTNTNAAARYIRCADIASTGATTPGTSTPVIDLAIPGNTAGAGFGISFKGRSFATGLTCWLVTGAADTDVAEVAANEIKVFYEFKQ